MSYNIQFVNTKTSDEIDALAREKLSALVQKHQWIVNASVYFKKEEKDPINGSICEIKISMPGPLVCASSNEPNFKIALNETLKDLNVQLKKRKDILNDRKAVFYKSA